MPSAPALIKMYNFPGCPFSERVEILMALKGRAAQIDSIEIDLSQARPDWLLKKTRGSTALPAMDTPAGTLKESMVILRYLEQAYPEVPVASREPYRHAVESLLALHDSGLSAAGYKMIKNRDPALVPELRAAVDQQFARIDAFLRDYSPDGTFLFEQFGWAETILTPVFKRMWFLEYYDDYAIPSPLTRVLAYRDACVAHPAAQKRRHDEIIKLYYDYSRGYASGSLPQGRSTASFTLSPNWADRPMPPRGKWGPAATDAELGLV